MSGMSRGIVGKLEKGWDEIMISTRQNKKCREEEERSIYLSSKVYEYTCR